MKFDTTQVIITGGTIDSYYEASKDTVVPNKTSVIPAILNAFKIDKKFLFSKICMKDSRALNALDRKKILATIQKSSCNKIIITHGTYTMPDTARYLKANLKKANKVIILTGSMIPISGFSPSDGTFNLGYSIAVADYLKPGIYVVMNGRVFDPAEVVKDMSGGKFGSIFSK